MRAHAAVLQPSQITAAEAAGLPSSDPRPATALPQAGPPFPGPKRVPSGPRAARAELRREGPPARRSRDPTGGEAALRGRGPFTPRPGPARPAPRRRFRRRVLTARSWGTAPLIARTVPLRQAREGSAGPESGPAASPSPGAAASSSRSRFPTGEAATSAIPAGQEPPPPPARAHRPPRPETPTERPPLSGPPSAARPDPGMHLARTAFPPSFLSPTMPRAAELAGPFWERRTDGALRPQRCGGRGQNLEQSQRRGPIGGQVP